MEVAAPELAQQPEQLIVPEVPAQEEIPQQRVQVNFEGFYKTELDRYKAELLTPQRKTWEILEKRAAKTEPWYWQEVYEGYKPRQISVAERFRRQALYLQARVEGVRDIRQFQQLVDYFESTVTERESVFLRFPKGLSEERKKKEQEKWAAKGYTGTNSFYEYDKYTSFSPEHQVPLRLKREQVKTLKGFMSSVNNPVEIAEGLRKIDFHFSEYTFGSEEQVAKLAQLFSAPFVREAIAAAQRVKHWNVEWFADKGGYGHRAIEIGQIDFLIQLAQNPDPKFVLSDELVQKINVISGAMKQRVGVPEIERFKTIADNPDYLELVSIVSQHEHSYYYYREGIPPFNNMAALDQAGVLKPLIALRHAGVAIGDDSLKTLFDSYEARDKPQEVQQQVITQLQEQLADPEIQTFMQDPTKQEFVGLFANITGHPVRIDELKSLDDLFGKGLNKRSEAIYLAKLLYGSEEIKYKPDLSLISGIIQNSNAARAFTDQDFPRFLEDLRTKGGFRPNSYDLYLNGSSKIADVFNNPEKRQALTQDTTLKIIKTLHPQGRGVDFYKPEYYIGLAQNPNALRTINLLKDLGCEFGSFDSLPSKETIETLANSPESLTKLALPELKDLAAKLKGELKWEGRSYDVAQLLKIYDDKDFQQQLFAPDNLGFLKNMRPNGLSLSEVKPLLALDAPTRELLVELAGKFGYKPSFGWDKTLNSQYMLSRLLTDTQLRESLFSEKTQQLISELGKSKVGYYHFNPQDIELLISLPSDFPEFVGELKTKYSCYFSERDLALLGSLQNDKENLYQLLDGLVGSGYILSLADLDKLAPLVGLADKIPTLLSDLKELAGYQFDPKDTQLLAALAGGNFTRERLTALKELFERYKNQYDGNFGLQWIQKVSILENNEAVITQLEQNTGYKFTLPDTESLRFLINAPDKNKIFTALNVLQSKFSMQFQMNEMSLYVSLSNIPDLGRKLDEAAMSLPTEELSNSLNLKLFARLGGEVGLYNHAKKLIYDDYFRNIRDAQNRIGQFMNSVYRGEISDSAVARIFAVSTKATELDRLALKLGINAEIARAANREDWYGSLLQASNFQEANEGLTKLMTGLAIPVVYGDLQGEDFISKQNELVELANKDKEFGDILEICCRSVGVYGKKYPDKGKGEFATLMGAIRKSLELNLERNPKAYLDKRAELSKHQFDRIFEDMSQDVRDRVMKTWLDLAPRRRLRVSGDVITAEEATLSRLNRIRDIVHTDLSVHLQELFTTKVRDLEAGAKKGETNGLGAEQLAIYKQYLMTPEGLIRQDIPMMYRSVETFIRDAQAALKNPETPKEEKGRLGKSLGTYQGISDSLKSVYRLGTISEERYKARKDYLNEIDKHIGEFSGALKRLKILDPDKRSADINTRALEEEVLLDFGKLRGTMAEENVSGQTVFETESTVAFRNLARAPEITQSCQRLTEVTGYNHAAYSRLLDGSNEMIDIYEMRNGERNRLARSFVELSKVRLAGEEQAKLTVLIDREYVNPQYQNFGNQFSSEMILHMLDRLSAAPELSLVFDSNRFTASLDVQAILKTRGYQLKQVSGQYFINESNVKLTKYYDSMGGVVNVSQPSYKQFNNFYLIEKV